VTRRKDSLVVDAARRVTRTEIGHPEGFLEAFANLYSDFARAVFARMRREAPDQIDRALWAPSLKAFGPTHERGKH